MNNKIFIGTKIYTFKDEDEEPTIYRVVGYKESKDLYKLRNVNNDEIIYISKDELYNDDNEYTMLKPDGLITFNLAKMEDNNVKDVIICIHNNMNETSYVYAVCRQCCEDIFVNKTVIHNRDNFCFGISVNRDTCPANINFETFLICKSVSKTYVASIYLEDNFDDIIKYILSGINHKLLNTTLRNTKKYLSKGTLDRGFNDNIIDLLKINNFMYDFHMAFKVQELDICIEENQEFLYPQDIIELEKTIGEKISNAYIIKYSKEIDLSSIMRKYLLVNPKIGDSSSVYIIGYDILDESYVPDFRKY